MIRIRALSSLSLIAAGLTGCGGGSRHESTEVYYLIVANVKIAYWQEAAVGMSEAAKALGVRYEVAGPDTYDPKAEKEVFDRIVNRSPTPAGILVSVANPEVLGPSIDAAVAKGIPVITLDADAPKSKRLFFIGTDNYDVGQMGGQLVADALKGRGNVAVYTMPGQANLDQRLDGYKRAFSRYPDIKIIQTIDVKGDPVAAFDGTKTLLGAAVKPDAFVCLEALACQEVADVLDREKISGKLVMAMDTNPGTMDWIKKGVIRATIAQKPYTMAYYGLRLADDLHHNKPSGMGEDHSNDTRSPVPHHVDTGVTMVDKNNIEEFVGARAAN